MGEAVARHWTKQFMCWPLPLCLAVEVTVIHTSATCIFMQMSALKRTSESGAWPINPVGVRNVVFTMRVQPHLFKLITHTIQVIKVCQPSILTSHPGHCKECLLGSINHQDSYPLWVESMWKDVAVGGCRFPSRVCKTNAQIDSHTLAHECMYMYVWN